MMSSMHANLPYVAALDPSSSSIEFHGASDTCSWLQRFQIQRDEMEEPTRREWKGRNSPLFNTRLSASAMVLARKRKRKLLNDKRLSEDTEYSDYNAGDSERDSLNMEEQLTAFVEYNGSDMDSLDINPSQDFNGEEQDIGTQISQCMQSCSWEDLTDVDQIEDEASEVFDSDTKYTNHFVTDVISASRPALMPTATNTSVGCSSQNLRDFSSACFLEKTKTVSKNEVVNGFPCDKSDVSFNGKAVNATGRMEQSVKAATLHTSVGGDSAPRTTFKVKELLTQLRPIEALISFLPQWKHRRSVKRDCSFLDTCSTSERMSLHPSATSVGTSESSSDKVIELKDGCFDSSDDVPEIFTPRSKTFRRFQPSLGEPTFSLTVSSSPFMRFQPRLPRKRRKVSQLTLDGFYRL
ncbi:hypothetical protein PsorP6_005283 [Peronosclerospora sorghi]|uniref:Uncharacterized protein n=1 Tax=Peronosclerospora sorghi TaxID=230839 RepID=A0ACC0W6L3_9STRA|nr:hypothetical protein PsorP6_005283 [Peronosclerospora sorghi]